MMSKLIFLHISSTAKELIALEKIKGVKGPFKQLQWDFFQN